MLKLKRLGRGITAAALCCALIMLMVAPVSAFSLPSIPYTSSVIPDISDTLVSNEPTVQQSQRVSCVRRSASPNSAVIGNFSDGTRLTVLGTKGKYYKVDCYDMNGYILKEQVAVGENGVYFVSCKENSADTTYLNTYTNQESLELRSLIRSYAFAQIGVRYVHGGTTTRGFDCSGFTQYVFKKAGFDASRSLMLQMASGIIVAREDLQCGDLVIFSNTGGGGFASHIGIYIGNNQIIHASSSRGVVVASLSNSYFNSHYQCARRVIISDLTPAATIPSVGILQSSNASYWRTETEDSTLGLH